MWLRGEDDGRRWLPQFVCHAYALWRKHAQNARVGTAGESRDSLGPRDMQRPDAQLPRLRTFPALKHSCCRRRGYDGLKEDLQ